jgi:phage shock protein C
MKKLYRSRKNKVIFGVCGGIGDYFRIDPFIIRLSVLFFVIITTGIPGLIAYLICAAIIPKEPKGYQPKPYKKLYRSKNDRKIAGICGGVSELFKWDSTWIRIIFIVILILSAGVPLLLIYLIGWIIIPEKPFQSIENK